MHIVIGEAGQFSLAQARVLRHRHLHQRPCRQRFRLAVSAVGPGRLVSWPGWWGCSIGTIALRMRDIYLALATFAFGEAMQWVFLNWTSVTGGAERR